jgi:hypothetical protein
MLSLEGLRATLVAYSGDTLHSPEALAEGERWVPMAMLETCGWSVYRAICVGGGKQ